MSGCNGVSAADRRWSEAAREAGVGEGCVETQGKTAEKTKKDQRPTLGGGLGKTGAKTGVEVLAMSKGTTAILGGAGAILATTGAHLHAFFAAHADAAELRDAYARDAVNLAVVWAASGALPNAYVQRVSYELRAVAGERGGASKILTFAMKNDKEWQEMKTEVEKQASFGRKIAMKGGITTRSELASRLQNDPGFAAAYKSGAAFRHGIEAFLMECDQERILRKKGT